MLSSIWIIHCHEVRTLINATQASKLPFRHIRSRKEKYEVALKGKQSVKFNQAQPLLFCGWNQNT